MKSNRNKLAVAAVVAALLAGTAAEASSVTAPKKPVLPALRPVPAGMTSTSYTAFRDNMEAGYVSLLTIPWYPGMDDIDNRFGIAHIVRKAVPVIANVPTHTATFPCQGYHFDQDSKQTLIECAFYPAGSVYGPWHGGNFNITAPDMQRLFREGAYWGGYSGY